MTGEQSLVTYEPAAVVVIATTVETKNTLKDSIGFAPNPLQNFMPEYTHF